MRSQQPLHNRECGSAFLEDTYISGLLKIQGVTDAEVDPSSWLVDRAATYLQHDMVPP